MADVFLSYRKLDRHHVQRVAAALEAAGLTTWWDDRIDPVEKWEKEIWNALNRSKAVLVLWTPAALESSFVREEAKRGAKRRRLVQAMFETCEIPQEFVGRKTGQQYYDVVGWRPGFEHDGWSKLLERLKVQCDRRRGWFATKSRSRSDARHWKNGVLRGDAIGSAPTVGTVFSDRETTPELVVIPQGSFVMGSSGDEEGRYRDGREDPQHQVSISKPIAVGRFAVSVEEFAKFVAATGHQTPGVRTYWDGEKWNEATTLWGEDAQAGTWKKNPARQTERHPVILVSWDDASAYCAWLSSVTNQRYRLLSEAEWEYCCRAGSTGPFSFGNTLNTLQANFNGAHSYGGKRGGRNREATVKVDELPPNDWGLYQMHGNVWEWVGDKFAHGYANAPIDGMANESGDEDYRCMRGGSYTDPPKHLRSACRGWAEPDLRSYSVGFRVARDL